RGSRRGKTRNDAKPSDHCGTGCGESACAKYVAGDCRSEQKFAERRSARSVIERDRLKHGYKSDRHLEANRFRRKSIGTRVAGIRTKRAAIVVRAGKFRPIFSHRIKPVDWAEQKETGRLEWQLNIGTPTRRSRLALGSP